VPTRRRKSCTTIRIPLGWWLPDGAFKRPMDVVEAEDIRVAAKLAILEALEADERALQRAEDEGMGGGEHAHLQKVQTALAHLRDAEKVTRFQFEKIL
jgi:hypothetical protein